MSERKWFWAGVAALVAINTLDLVMLKAYMADWRYETFPPLAWAIREAGLSSALWLVRAAFYGSLVLLVMLPPSRRLNGCVALYNAVYWTAMLDWLFVLKEMGRAPW